MYLYVSYTGIYSFIPLLFLLSLSQCIFHYEYILFKNISQSLSYSVLQQIAYFKDGYKHMPHAKRELFPAYLVFELRVRVLWTWKQRLFKSSATRRSYLHISLSDENVISTQSHIYNLSFTTYGYKQNILIYLSITICSLQSRRIHATIHHDYAQTFAPILQLHETYYIRGYDLCRGLLTSARENFYCDIIFQPTTTLHQCPSSTIPKFLFLPTDYSTIKSIGGYDTFVAGKS